MQQEKKPKYEELTRDLRSQILGGAIRPKDKLPSENALAARYGVSRQTVRKALGILTQEGYVYAEHGRGTFCSGLLKACGPSKNIAVVTTYLTDYIFPQVIQGIEQVLSEHGYSILLKSTKNSRTAEARCLEELLQKNIDGLIIEPSRSHIFCRHTHLYEMLEQCGIPCVFIQGNYAQMQELPYILLDDCRGGYLATAHLTGLGHRRIVGVFKSDDVQGQKRHRGYADALREAGIGYDADLVIWYYTEDRRQHPYQEVRRLAKMYRQRPFDAVVAYNDQIAVDVIRALLEEGLSCPADVSVTGYDDSYLAATCSVGLTTVAHPKERLGEAAANLLLRLLQADVPLSERQIVMEPRLIVRDSCKKRT